MPPDPGSIKGQVLALSVKAQRVSECVVHLPGGTLEPTLLEEALGGYCKNLLWFHDGCRNLGNRRQVQSERGCQFIEKVSIFPLLTRVEDSRLICRF